MFIHVPLQRRYYYDYVAFLLVAGLLLASACLTHVLTPSYPYHHCSVIVFPLSK